MLLCIAVTIDEHITVIKWKAYLYKSPHDSRFFLFSMAFALYLSEASGFVLTRELFISGVAGGVRSLAPLPENKNMYITRAAFTHTSHTRLMPRAQNFEMEKILKIL